MPRKTKTGKTGKKRSRVRKSRKNKSRRYRGGCEKCNQVSQSLWSSSGPMVRGGSQQINEDIYNYKTDPYFYSSS